MDMITPNWQPLERLHTTHAYLFEMNDFMWMQRHDAIECYKHRMTRSPEKKRLSRE
jgi:hypothetical protein